MGFVIYNPYVVAIIATIGGMFFGFDISSVSAFVAQPQYREFFHNTDSLTQGGITASMAGGSFLGSLVIGFISDKFGRRMCARLTGGIWVIGAAIQCSSRDQAQLIVGRVIAGVAIGFGSSTIPVYLSELAPKDIRGRLVGCFQWSVTWGIMIMFYIGYGCSFISGPASFRTAWGIMMVPGSILFLGTFILPESPRWLASKDRWEESIEIISKIQAGGDVNNETVTIEIEEIREAIDIERQHKDFSVFDLFNRKNINRTMVGIWVQIWQQMTGVNVMMYYIVLMFEMAGYTGNTNLVSSSIQYVINVVMTVPALLFLDKWGRRHVFIFGSILMMGWLLATTGLLAQYSVPVSEVAGNNQIRIIVNDKRASKGIIACSYLFVATFAPTWGPGAWVYSSEIFPTGQRAVAAATCASANWAFNFALAMFVPSAFTNITWKTYIIFAVCCFVMTFHVYFLFPETKGRTLEEINMMWDSGVPAWRSASWVPPDFIGRQHAIEEKDAAEHDESLDIPHSDGTKAV